MVSRPRLHTAVALPVTLVLLAIADALLTRWGLAGGWVVEVNPLMAYLFARDARIAMAYCIGSTALAAVVLHAYRWHPVAHYGLRGLLAVRVGVMVLHGVWVWQTFVMT